LPDEIHKINLSFIVNKFDKRRGGTAGNVSYTLGLLETKNILFSAAGKDFPEYKKPFNHMPVNLDHVLIDPSQFTATGFAMTDKTNNQIWGYFYGAAESIGKMDVTSVAKKKDIVLIGPSGAKASMQLLKQCIQGEIAYMFDPGFILTQISDADLEMGISGAEFIVGNDYEVDLMKKRVKNWDNVVKDKTVITTLGEKGAQIKIGDKIYTVSPAHPMRVVDPTGAGDAWRAGFLAGIERGYDYLVSGQIGSVAASYAIEHYGTQEHTFTVKQFTDRYRQVFGSEVEL